MVVAHRPAQSPSAPEGRPASPSRPETTSGVTVVSRPSPPADPARAPVLLRACCLRCSKRYSGIPSLACVHPAPGQKCRRCTRLKKPCEQVSIPPFYCFSPSRRRLLLTAYVRQVPASCLTVLRDVQHAARLVLHLQLSRNHGIPNRRCHLQDAIASLEDYQQAYTKEVETAVRIAPSSPEEIAPRMLALLEELVAGQRQLIGLMRYQVSSLLPLL